MPFYQWIPLIQMPPGINQQRHVPVSGRFQVLRQYAAFLHQSDGRKHPPQIAHTADIPVSGCLIVSGFLQLSAHKLGENDHLIKLGLVCPPVFVNQIHQLTEVNNMDFLVRSEHSIEPVKLIPSLEAMLQV